MVEIWANRTAIALGLALAVQAIWTSYVGMYDPGLHRTLVFGLCALAVVLANPLASRMKLSGFPAAAAWMADAVLIGAIAMGIERFVTGQANFANMLMDLPVFDQWVALFAMLATLELTRREFGLGLAAVAGLMLAYCLWGQSLPGVLQHAGFTLAQLTEGMWYGFQGVFGLPASVVIELLYIYIIFGVVLEATGAGPALIKIAVRLTGRVPGGSAHAATVASALFGSMSGSVTANVAGTGTFTIPMMKKKGFSPEFAGAVEAAASTAGQFIPPVMGAVAFMLAQLTSTNYLLVCAAAIVPAAIYILSLFVSVYLEAQRLGMRPENPKTLPRLTREDAIHSLMFAIPVAVVIGVMMMGRSPAMAGFWATISAIALGLALNPQLRKRPQILLAALAHGGLSGAKIMVAVGAIGIVVAGFNLTGVGLSFAQTVSALGSDNLLLSLILTGLACLVLGMGMPTLPAYLIIVLVMGPALQSLGVPRLAAHMFVLYFAVLSAITPPVALAAFAAAPIAGANPMKIALVSMRLTLVGFIVPFVFVYNPSLLLVVGFEPTDFAIGLLRLIALVWTLGVGFAGYGFGGPVGPVWRGLHLFAALLLLFRNTGLDLAGLALVVLLTVLILRRRSATLSGEML
ncbi:TRAP transporter fused permease subunit [Rhizobium sp. L1K21]|uniref:TRAP transporter permease n=1 Tax=Rhizobium sp. L1K21 TaxID=2954933 RepID=UPI002092A99D|nr:TRAP transporter fused permease subunit [Rhizobium sp. L1K21]MCO6188493.1 TRAP transporter fused permease subunit [Rhizobium sp. L1K21]